MNRFLSRPLQTAALLAATSLLSLATEPAKSPAPKISLKPFRQDAPAKSAETVAGTWKGTFSSSLPNGGKEEVTYLVEVASDLDTFRVSAISPLPNSLDRFLNPITAMAAPADWNGEVLKVELRETAQDGDTQITVVKKFTLRAGSDARHATFTYHVTVKSTKPNAVNTNILQGDGTLTRMR